MSSCHSRTAWVHCELAGSCGDSAKGFFPRDAFSEHCAGMAHSYVVDGTDQLTSVCKTVVIRCGAIWCFHSRTFRILPCILFVGTLLVLWVMERTLHCLLHAVGRGEAEMYRNALDIFDRW